MAYEYVPEEEYVPYIEKVKTSLAKLKMAVKRDLEIEKFKLIGSADMRIVTRLEGQKTFDLDFDIFISRADERWNGNLGGLKSYIKSKLDMILPNMLGVYVKDGSDSASVITYNAYKGWWDKDKLFSIDICIFIKNAEGRYLMLYHDKKSEQYILNIRNHKSLVDEANKLRSITKHNLTERLKESYLKKKNNNSQGKLSWQLFKEAIEETLQAYAQKKKAKRLSKSKDKTKSAKQSSASIKAALDNHANQLNPNSAAYKAGMDNRANQLNPNNKAKKKLKNQRTDESQDRTK